MERLDMFALTFRFYPDETPEGTRWCVHETTHQTLDQAREKLGGLVTGITGYMPDEVTFEEVTGKGLIRGTVTVEAVDETMEYTIVNRKGLKA
jgi:hypothetical protein